MVSELDVGLARSSRIAMDPRIKTYQNAQESQIEPKAIWGYFFCGISEIGKIKEKFGGIGGNTSQIRGNLKLWYHMVRAKPSRVARSSRIDERVDERTQEHEEHEEQENTNVTSQIYNKN